MSDLAERGRTQVIGHAFNENSEDYQGNKEAHYNIV